MATSSDIYILESERQLKREGSLLTILTNSGYLTKSFNDYDNLEQQFKLHPSSVLIINCLDKPIDAIDIHKKLSSLYSHLQSIIIQKTHNVIFSLQAANQGIFWVVDHDYSDEEILILVARALVTSNLFSENQDLKSALSRPYSSLNSAIFKSNIMQKVLLRMQKIAELDATVLLTGESGTGKTLFANLIHQASQRSKSQFMSISCANLPRDLIEAELFGYEKGAFTGAHTSRAGCFELCNNGTIFLDEIGELPLDLQPKLLTVLQDRRIRRLGGRVEKQVDTRVICATNKDLKQEVSKGRFREDLFYRINVLTLEMPALRDRAEDIEELAKLTLQKISGSKRKSKTLSKDALELLKSHTWPGNLRELTHLLERVAAFSDQQIISSDDLRSEIDNSRINELSALNCPPRKLDEVIRETLRSTLTSCSGDKKQAAKILGISLKTVYNYLKQYPELQDNHNTN